MEKRLKDYFTKTYMGTENTKEISKNIRSFIKDKYNVEVETKKKHSTIWFGGSVTGENIKEIFIDINSKEKFDLVDFLDNFNECKFVYDNSLSKNWRFSIMPYYVNLYLNNVKLNVGERFNTSFVDVNMILAEAFDNISREEYFIKNRENLTNLYNEKIKKISNIYLKLNK